MFHYGEGQALALRNPPGRRGLKPRLPLFSARGACPLRTCRCQGQDRAILPYRELDFIFESGEGQAPALR